MFNITPVSPPHFKMLDHQYEIFFSIAVCGFRSSRFFQL